MKYDVAIIGGGPAGYTAAEKAAAGGLSTVLFEKNALGGVCLNEGCVPTKTLLYSAKVFDTIKHAPKYAVSAENPAFDFPKIIARKNKVVKKLTAGIRMKMKENGVEVPLALCNIFSQAGFYNSNFVSSGFGVTWNDLPFWNTVRQSSMVRFTLSRSIRPSLAQPFMKVSRSL